MTFDPRRVSRALARFASILLALGLFAAPLAPVSADPAGGTPKIVSVDITGNLRVPTATIMAVVAARPGQYYDPRVVQQDLARINALGYFADIAPPLVRERPNGVAITYRVIENPVLTKITFVGNTTVPSDTLLALMDLSVGQVFNTNTFRQDVLKINSYYERTGFGGQLPTHVKDINLDPKTGALTLTVQEGLTVRHLIIGGDPLLPPAAFYPILSVKPGIVYSDALREKDVAAIKSFYEDKLHIELGNFEGGIDPSSIDLKAGTADVKYNIYVARIAVVQITGNTRTKDQVIRRELRVRPGMVLNTDAVKRDYERLNALGFFSKVEPDIKEGPDPKTPQDVTIVWHVTEQHTASASVGFGYQGGLTGQGLYGTLGFSDNNLHGTGNSVGLNFEQGARTYSTQLQFSVPYVGNTPRSQKYSFAANLFSNGYTYYYPVYAVGGSGPAIAPGTGATPGPIPVTLYSSNAGGQISGVNSTSVSKSIGLSGTLGRRLSDYTNVTASLGAQNIRYDTTVPAPYYFPQSQANIIAGPTPGPLNSNIYNTNGTFGIQASSIANINTGLPYRLNTFSLGATSITLDNPLNPSRGWNTTLQEIFSAPSIGSDFQYTQTNLSAARFFPVLRDATIGFHGVANLTTGTIPPNSLFTFSDQQVRGYNQVFYATDAYLGQIELRQPLTPDRKLTVALFVDELDYRIYGAEPLRNPYTNRITSYPGNFALVGDYGFGLRFDVPQLGLHTVRIDFAKGSQGTHTSFGIGQSF
ncbi:MAG: outer membrane protein assembly factor [Vulcanimicrobiaceae bacterium]